MVCFLLVFAFAFDLVLSSENVSKGLSSLGAPVLSKETPLQIPIYSNYHPAFLPIQVNKCIRTSLYAAISRKCFDAQNPLKCFRNYFPRCTLKVFRTSEPLCIIPDNITFPVGSTFVQNEILSSGLAISPFEGRIELERFYAPNHGFVASFGEWVVGEEFPRHTPILTFLSFSPEYPSIAVDNSVCLYAWDGRLKLDMSVSKPMIEFVKEMSAENLLEDHAFRMALAEMYAAFESRCQDDVDRTEIFRKIFPLHDMCPLVSLTENFCVLYTIPPSAVITRESTLLMVRMKENSDKRGIYPGTLNGICIKSTPIESADCKAPRASYRKIWGLCIREMPVNSKFLSINQLAVFLDQAILLLNKFFFTDDSAGLTVDSMNFMYEFQAMYYYMISIFLHSMMAPEVHHQDLRLFKDRALRMLAHKANGFSELLLGSLIFRNLAFPHLQITDIAGLRTFYTQLLGLIFKWLSLDRLLSLESFANDCSAYAKQHPKSSPFIVLNDISTLNPKLYPGVLPKLHAKRSEFIKRFSFDNYQKIMPRASLPLVLKDAKDTPLLQTVDMTVSSTPLIQSIEKKTSKRLFSSRRIYNKVARVAAHYDSQALYSHSWPETLGSAYLRRMHFLKRLDSSTLVVINGACVPVAKAQTLLKKIQYLNGEKEIAATWKSVISTFT